MNRGKRSFEERSRGRLLDLWTPREEFGAPVGCIATTFTFDAGFFEQECLGRFARIESDPNDDARLYVLEREEKLAQLFTCLIVDQRNVPTGRSLRWHVLPTRVHGGIQHSKLSLLVWERAVRVVVSSANLTEPGYRSNYENAGTLEFTPEGSAPLDLLAQTLTFVRDVTVYTRAPGADTGPQAALRKFLSGIEARTRDWPAAPWKSRERAELLPVIPGRRSLFSQLGDVTRDRFDTCWVQSPFFDDDDGVADVLPQLYGLLAQRREREVSFIVPGLRRPDASVELAAPARLKQSPPKTAHYFSYVDEFEQGGAGSPAGIRALHAKSIWLQNDTAALCCIGSSNFTRAGTGLAKAGSKGNIELNLVYVLPDRESTLAKVCSQAWPPCVELDLDETDVRFVPSERDRSSDGDEIPPLPGVFGEAIFHGGPLPALELELVGVPPAGFEVYSDVSQLLFSSERWVVEGATRHTRIAWDDKRPPSYLVVHWVDSEHATRRSIWTVNVADPSTLPPPEELASLGLEDLLAILTSGLKPYQVAAKLLREREKATASGTKAIIDPHKRVESLTRNFLLKRMNRFSAALEGMRERLEQPVSRLDSLLWRVRGPYGPLALAAQVATEAGEGAAFMIAEMAEMVGTARLQVSGELTQKAGKSALAEVIAELHARAADHPSPPALKAYAAQVFTELAK